MEDDRYLPEHVYANWLLLAARVAAGAPDREDWRRWAREHFVSRTESAPTVEPPARGVICARRPGHMAEAEPPAARSRRR